MTRRRGAALGLAALVLLGLALGASGRFPQEPLRRRVEALLAREVGKASVSRLHVVPGRLSAEVHGLALEAPGISVAIDRADLVLAPSSLLGEVALRSVRAGGVVVTLRPGQLPASAPSGPRPRLPLVERLDVRRASLVVEGLPGGARATLGPIEIAGGVGVATLRVRAPAGAVEGPYSLTVGPVEAELRISPALDVEIVAARLASTRGSRLSASGRLAREGRLAPDARLDGEVALAEAAFLGVGIPLDGRVTLAARLGEQGGSPSLEARVEGAGLRVAGQVVDVLRVDGRRTARGATAEASVGLLGGQLDLEASYAGAAALARARWSSVDIGRLARSAGLGAPPFSGASSGQLDLSGDPHGALDLGLAANAAVSGAGLAGEVHAGARGRIDVAQASADLEWEAEVRATPLTTQALGAAGGSVRGKGKLAGTWPPRVEGELVLEARRVAGGEPTIAGRGPLLISEGRVTAQLEGEALGGRWRGGLALRGTEIERAGLSATGLGLGVASPELAGTLAFEGSLAGGLAGALEARAEGVAYRGLAVGPVSLEARGDPTRVTLDVSATDLGLRLDGAIVDPADQGRLEGRLRVEGLALERLRPMLPAELSGVVSAAFDVRVPLAHPDRASARGEIASLALAAGPASFAAQHPFRVSFVDRRLAVEGLALASRGLSLTGSAQVGADPPYALEASLEGDVSLGELPFPAGVSAEGRARLELRAAGSLREPRLEGSLSFEEVALAAGGFPAVRIEPGRLRFDGGAVLAEKLAVRAADGRLTLDARVPFAAGLQPARRQPRALAPEEEAQVRLRFDGVSLAELAAGRAPGVPLDGRLSGTVDLAGGLASLDEVRASARLEATSLAVAEAQVRIGQLDARLAAGRIELAEATIETSAGALRLAGKLDLVRDEVDAGAAGAVELRAVSAFLPDAALSGHAELDLRAAGPRSAPRVHGTLRIEDAAGRVRPFRDALTGIAASLQLADDRVRIESASARLGGGTLTAAGGARLAGASLADVDVTLTGRDMTLRYPEGLRARLDADLALRGSSDQATLSGTVRAQRGLYDLDAALASTLRAVVVPPSPLLRKVAMDVRVELAGPVAMRHPLADLRVGGALDFHGDLAEPLPLGRLEVLPAGKVFLQDRTFDIESGRILYDGTWNPLLDLRARADIEGTDALGTRNLYSVTASVGGRLEAPVTSFRSTPPLAEREILGLIASGQTGAEALRAGAYIAGEQAAGFLTRRFTRGLTAGLRGLGFDEVSIQPELLARELQPSARFTFKKELLPRTSLVSSLSLKEPQDPFLQLDVRPGWRLGLFAQRREDASFTLGGGQQVRLGAPAGAPAAGEARAERGARLAEVRFSGASPLSEPEMRDAIEARPGRRVTPWSLADDADRLRDRLRRAGHLEAEVSARLDGEVALLETRAGPRFELRVEGVAAPDGFESILRDAIDESEALSAGRDRLLGGLAREGYARARVEAEALPGGDERVLRFVVDPGRRYAEVRARFPGARALGEGRLLEAAGGITRLLVAPAEACAGIQDAYRSIHLLAARAGTPKVVEEGASLAIEVAIDEGPAARVAEVRFEGSSLANEELLGVLALPLAEPYDEARVSEAVGRVQSHYLGLGHPWARVVAEAAASGDDVVVLVRVSEGDAVRIGSVVIEGCERTREALVRSRLPFAVGDPLDPRRLAQAERRIAELGVFSSVSVTATPGAETDVRVVVREDARLVAAYDLRWNSEAKGRAQLDAELRNLFGLGVSLGGRQSVGADALETRVSLHAARLGPLGSLTAAGFRLSQEIEGGFGDAVQRGVELQSQIPLGRRLQALYGYRFKRVGVTGFEPVDVAGLDASLLRDTRDSALDSSRGAFLSLNLEVSPKRIGSDFDFVKGFAQAFFNVRLSPRLSLAQGTRLGLAHVFHDEPLVSTERFRTGGATTVRGYENESLGPRNVFDEPAGGQAVLVLNQELRFRHSSGLGAVLFWDAGNVFRSARDLSADLRHGVGFGLRYASPLGVLRLDLGFPVARREGEKAWRVYFSIGQAF